ncbi:hypothetical protein JCGZ_24138 [Jatropha curcas]|uniref:Aminotransferase-like plant mobile domain-containing protein n=1 Tax=Jatropha curcas TaxID=180498 RepID=A0A067LGJ4_JATCU|nr:hypothetical protein JCGZ_24138 [Jatropha curcas]
MLGLSVEEAREFVVDDQADLAGIIKWYLDQLNFMDLEFQRFRTRALIFYLVSTCVLARPVDWGDLRVANLVLQMERVAGTDSMALAETILCLNRAYRVDGVWSTSPILLQSRAAHVVEARVTRGKTAAYEAWWIAELGDREGEHRATLTQDINIRLEVTTRTTLDSTQQANPEDSDDSRDTHPKQHR